MGTLHSEALVLTQLLDCTLLSPGTIDVIPERLQSGVRRYVPHPMSSQSRTEPARAAQQWSAKA